MMAANDLDKKKLLMRYKRLKQEVLQRDAAFTNKVMRNYFTCIRKVGTVEKKSPGFLGRWQKRFVVLSNAGLIYFKVGDMQSKDDLAPQQFKPLNDFVIKEVSEQVSIVKLLLMCETLSDLIETFLSDRILESRTASTSFSANRASRSLCC